MGEKKNKLLLRANEVPRLLDNDFVSAEMQPYIIWRIIAVVRLARGSKMGDFIPWTCLAEDISSFAVAKFAQVEQTKSISRIEFIFTVGILKKVYCALDGGRPRCPNVQVNFESKRPARVDSHNRLI